MAKDLKRNQNPRPMSKPKAKVGAKPNPKLSLRSQAKPETKLFEKTKGLHPRNLHKEGYDFKGLIKSFPPLGTYVKSNAFGKKSIDFADAFAVKILNAALLKKYYSINFWDIPQGALCPPIPGRVDYIHYVAELLNVNKAGFHEKNVESKIKMLDIGTGANGIYLLLASQIYGWHCVGTDINKQSLENVHSILAKNLKLKDRIELRRQYDKDLIFEGIIKPEEYFDISVCNPPFHSSKEEAQKSSLRKVINLAKNPGEKTAKLKSTTSTLSLNFGGLDQELWYKGGELLFLKNMINESQKFSNQIAWFTSLVSKSENLASSIKLIKNLGATEVKEIEMVQGNKLTRILAWTYKKT